ncbi:MAG: hypothetical protein WEB58_13405 [Planctomycetaceae bacterium]
MKTWLLAMGIGVAGVAISCEQQGETTSPPAKTTKAPATAALGDHEHGDGDHPHGEQGPHGGDLAELGKGEYHAEVIHDEETETVTVYLLDRSAKKSVSIDAESLRVNVTGVGEPQQYQLMAVADEDQGGEGSSRFELTDEALGTVLHHEHAKARITVAIEGKSYSGMFPVTHEGHDHGNGHSLSHKDAHGHDGK